MACGQWTARFDARARGRFSRTTGYSSLALCVAILVLMEDTRQGLAKGHTMYSVVYVLHTELHCFVLSMYGRSAQPPPDARAYSFSIVAAISGALAR